ncbi:MAG: hypothetical protein IT385_19175 [Deltaproteobacteria bacterium]|nr:hypothetical protein [Deltaproteobacteria bacterium]
MPIFRPLVAAALALGTSIAPACGKGGAPSAPPADAVAAAPAPEPAEPSPAPVAPDAAPAPEADAAAAPATPPTDAGPANNGEERDPSATDKVETTTLSEDAFEGVELPGQTRKIIGWRDKNGTNAILIKREWPKGAGAQLVAYHLNREGDASWTTLRDYKELVSDCNDFRLTLEPYTGPWSVTDLDNDGYGEATFAWTAGCRTDWSPVTHKVLLVESGAKYVLRGTTKSADSAADPDFAKAPPTFLDHARSVWASTSTEAPPARSAYESEAEWGNDFLSWERLGPIPAGASAAVIKATFGEPASVSAITHDEDATGKYFQTWRYPAQGIELTLEGEKADLADGALSALRTKAPSKLTTRLGITIGSSEAELKAAYDAFRNTEYSYGRYLAIGIEWTWLTFEVEDGKVVAISEGLGQQPPSKE